MISESLDMPRVNILPDQGTINFLDNVGEYLELCYMVVNNLQPKEQLTVSNDEHLVDKGGT